MFETSKVVKAAIKVDTEVDVKPNVQENRQPRSERGRPRPLMASNVHSSTLKNMPNCPVKRMLMQEIEADPSVIVDYTPPNDKGVLGRYVYINATTYMNYPDNGTSIKKAFVEGGKEGRHVLPEVKKPDEYDYFYFSPFQTNHNCFINGISPFASIATIRAACSEGIKTNNGFCTLPDLVEHNFEDGVKEWRRVLIETNFSGTQPIKGKKGSRAGLICFVVLKKKAIWRILGASRDVKVCFLGWNELPFPLTKDPSDDKYIMLDRSKYMVKLVPGEAASVNLKERQNLVKAHNLELLNHSQESRVLDVCPENGLASLASVTYASVMKDLAQELEKCPFANAPPVPADSLLPHRIKLFNLHGESYGGARFLPDWWTGRELIEQHLKEYLPSVEELRTGSASVLRKQGDEVTVKRLHENWSLVLQGVPGDCFLVGYVRLNGDWMRNRERKRSLEATTTLEAGSSSSAT